MTMPPSVGFLAQAKTVLENAVARSAAFQLLTGSADEAEAKEHVYLEILPRDDDDDTSIETMSKTELESKRPFCVVYVDMPAGVSIENRATGGNLTVSINAAYYFEVDIESMESDVMTYGQTPETIEEFAHYMDNIVGTIAVEVAEQHGDALNRLDQFDRRFSATRDKFSTGSWSSAHFFASVGTE